jgi:hypothetical protein
MCMLAGSANQKDFQAVSIVFYDGPGKLSPIVSPEFNNSTFSLSVTSSTIQFSMDFYVGKSNPLLRKCRYVPVARNYVAVRPGPECKVKNLISKSRDSTQFLEVNQYAQNILCVWSLSKYQHAAKISSQKFRWHSKKDIIYRYTFKNTSLNTVKWTSAFDSDIHLKIVKDITYPGDRCERQAKLISVFYRGTVAEYISLYKPQVTNFTYTPAR